MGEGISLINIPIASLNQTVGEVDFFGLIAPYSTIRFACERIF